jgi:hypothetical protein
MLRSLKPSERRRQSKQQPASSSNQSDLLLHSIVPKFPATNSGTKRGAVALVGDDRKSVNLKRGVGTWPTLQPDPEQSRISRRLSSWRR